MTSGKLKVLFLAADPYDHDTKLETGAEMRAIEHAIQAGMARDRIELVAHFATRIGDLQRALLHHRPDVVHFAGHGGYPGVIYLGNDYGQRQPVDRAALARLFEIVGGSIRLVVLNACDTEPVVDALSGVVDAAVGMNTEVFDTAALFFSESFYGALAMGTSVRQAFDLAVNRLQMQRIDEDVPVLRIREGASEAPLCTPTDVASPAAPDEPDAVGTIRAPEITARRFDLAALDVQGDGDLPGTGRLEVSAEKRIDADELTLAAVRRRPA